jgi:hypothetical protein
MIKHFGNESVEHVLALEAVAMSGYLRIHIQNAETIMAFEVGYMNVFSLTAISLNSLLTGNTRPYMTLFLP